EMENDPRSGLSGFRQQQNRKTTYTLNIAMTRLIIITSLFATSISSTQNHWNNGYGYIDKFNYNAINITGHV
ncbi:13217_t:CDS:2, partial [Funneliformis caledonium]